MIGKLAGKLIGSVLAAPAIVGKEVADAVDETGDTISRAWDRLIDYPPEKKEQK